MRTFATEDDRKTKLFDAWIHYLSEIHNRLVGCDLEKKYEGTADILRISRQSMDLKLEDGRKLRNIPITPQIFEKSLKSDSMYVILGQYERQWLPLDVISIGSLINPKKGEFHLTVNPVHVDLINAGRSAASFH